MDNTNEHAGVEPGAQGADAKLRGDGADGRGSDRAAVADLADSGSHRGVAPIPSSIVRASCAVQASVAAIAKTQFNKHGQYKFASTDDIYAAITRKLGEVGLMIYPLELTPTKREQSKVDVFDREGAKTGEKTVTLLTFHFGYVLATEDATWFDPRSSRTITVLHTGPQTYNSAESFCQKSYLRAWFKLPTGDMDLDSMPQADNEDDQIALVGGKKRKSSAEGKRDGSVKTFNELRAAISESINPEMLRHVRTSNAEEWASMPERWAATLDEDYEVKMSSFGAVQAAE